MVMTGRNTGAGEVEVDISVDTTDFERGMRLLGEQLAAFGEAAREALAPAFAALHAALDPIYCVDPGTPYSGHEGEPILTETDARAVLAHAEATSMLWRGRKIPKHHRRYAKARYLACRRILGEAPLRDVRTNQFLST